jgi:K+-sensing histidine kinase KdpD
MQALKKANSKKVYDPVVPFEYRIRHKNGSYRWLHTDGTVFNRDKNGNVSHVINVSVDITDMKEKELAQHMQRSKTETLLQTRLSQEAAVTELGISALSGKSLKDILDEAARRVHEVLQAEYISILEYMDSEKKLVFRAGVGWDKTVVIDSTEVATGKRSHAGYTLLVKQPVVMKDILLEKRFRISSPLSQHPAKSGVSCLIYGNTIPYGVFGVHSKSARVFTKEEINFLQSVANLLALTIERKRLENQKDEFIGIASHELKTPVTSIKAYTQVLENRFMKQGDEKSALLLSKMNTQIDRLTTLITDLLDVKKMQKGRLEFSPSYFDFNELVSEVVEQMQRMSEQHDLVTHMGRSKTVLADRERIGQVLTNFLTNAIKYSPDSKDVVIKIRSTKEEIIVSVQDFGLGIPKSKQRFVFERFFRVDGVQRSSFPGLGLGLFICLQIIKRHKGKIWVESKERRGSTFYFSIPVHGEAVEDIYE